MLDECYTSLNKVSKKKMMNIKRRFSDEQIRSLETMFESESKLEAPTKLRLARELGLQPRQVAIWFQNKRARSKSKELERDYTMLQDKYNTLVSQFESLKNEHQSLVMQLHKLHGLMEKSGEKSWYNGENINAEFEVKPGLSLDGSEHQVSVNSDDNKTKKAEYLGYDEEPAFLNVVEHADDCLTSPENWGSFGSDGLLDQSSGSHQWWDFWS